MLPRTLGFFRPAKDLTLSPVLTFTHPITKNKIRVASEICAEYSASVLKLNYSDFPPYLHIVNGNQTGVYTHHQCGKYMIIIDSMIKPCIILLENEDFSSMQFIAYQNNLLAVNLELEGPLRAIYPFERRIINKFNEYIEKLSDFPIYVKQLTTLRDDFVATMAPHPP
ncbi:MAG: hypothetical protein ABI597_07410 [Gammaproteobacteria bacterium]